MYNFTPQPAAFFFEIFWTFLLVYEIFHSPVKEFPFLKNKITIPKKEDMVLTCKYK